LNLLAGVYLNYEPVKIETLIGEKKSEQTSMRDVDIAIIKDYAAEDADITLQLQHKLEPELEKHQLRKLFDEVEMPLIPVLAGMETEGVALDPNALVEFSAQLEKEITVKKLQFMKQPE
jgi:DNA polymerase-1